nr:MAG TPA: hypothetical protein [Bacteriophage sp.]DAM83939.1 MAG TPA: hypothetical protein [Caudoviricetes sp.]
MKYFLKCSNISIRNFESLFEKRGGIHNGL